MGARKSSTSQTLELSKSNIKDYQKSNQQMMKIFQKTNRQNRRLMNRQFRALNRMNRDVLGGLKEQASSQVVASREQALRDRASGVSAQQDALDAMGASYLQRRMQERAMNDAASSQIDAANNAALSRQNLISQLIRSRSNY